MRLAVVAALACAALVAASPKKIPIGHNIMEKFRKAAASAPSARAASAADLPVPIVNGDPVTDATRYPFHVALMFAVGDNILGQFCGGSILDETHIITAAHCVSDSFIFNQGFTVLAVAGTTDISFGGSDSGSDSASGFGPGPLQALDSPTTQIRSACNVETANTYGHFSLEFFNDDMAVISVEEPFVFNEYVDSIDLPSAGQPMAGAIVTVIGHGEREDRSYPNILQETQVVVLPPEVCEAFWGSDPSTVFCTIDPRFEDLFLSGSGSDNFPDPSGSGSEGLTGSCFGDSGGPLFVPNPDREGRYTLVGLTSFGSDCLDIAPTGNTLVAGFPDRLSAGLALGSDQCCPPYSEVISAGSGSGSDGYECVPCQGNNAGAMCEQCPAGSFSVELNRVSACSVCPAGSYHRTAEDEFCTPCPTGTTSGDGATTCEIACTEPACPSDTCDDLTVVVEPDFFISEVTWEVLEHTSSGSNVIASGGGIGGSARLCSTYPVSFVVVDSYGDGICCEYGFGFIELYVNGVFIESINGDYGAGTSVPLNGNSDCNECFPLGNGGSDDDSDDGDCDALVPDVRMWRGNFIMTQSDFMDYCGRPGASCPSMTNIVVLNGEQWVLAPSQDSYQVAPDECAGLA